MLKMIPSALRELSVTALLLVCMSGLNSDVFGQEIQGTESDQPLSGDSRGGNNYGNSAPTEATGSGPGYLGIDFVPTVGQRGAYVRSVAAGGPAALAGLQAGDVITDVNSKPVRTDEDLASELTSARSGDPISITYLRGGISTTISTTLASVPSGVKIGKVPTTSTKSKLLLGIRSNPVSKAVQERFGLQTSDGVYVEQIYPGSPAEDAGLPADVVIVQMDSQEVRAPDDLKSRLRAEGAGKTITLFYWTPTNKSQTPDKAVITLGGSGGEDWQARQNGGLQSNNVESLQLEITRLREKIRQLEQELTLREQEIANLRAR